MADNHSGDFDVVLVGAGIMSMTLATFLKELQPHLKIKILERLEGEAGATLEFTEVLMIGSGASVKIGAPTVAGAKVTAELVESGRSSLWIAQQARLKVCATILCEASIRIGWVDAHFKPARIAPCVLQRLSP